MFISDFYIYQVLINLITQDIKVMSSIPSTQKLKLITEFYLSKLFQLE